MIEQDLVNARDLTISRPNRSGPGGDLVGDPTVIATKVDAIYEPANRIFRFEADGVSVIIFARYFVDPVDAEGTPVDYKVGDLINMTPPIGAPVVDQEIVNIEPWWGCGELDHVVLEVGRRV